MGRLLLLLPTTTYRAPDFMQAAEALQVEVVVGSDRRQALADLTPGKTIALDFSRPGVAAQEILEFARRYPLDAVLGVDDDSVVLASVANEALGLRHNSASSVRASRNKLLMRQRFVAKGLPSPGFRPFSIETDPGEVAGKIRFPCVLKPVFLSASRGVIRADDPGSFVSAFERITAFLGRDDVKKKGESPANEILVEDFIPGSEVALEGLLIRGELHVLALFDKPDPLEGPYFEETFYTTPSRLDAGLQEDIRDATAEASSAVGLEEGPVHAELRVNSEGVWIVEVAGRSIGGLCSRTLRFGAGMSLEELIIRHALGLEIESAVQSRSDASGVMMIPVPAKGRLEKVTGLESAKAVLGIEDIAMTIPIGEWVEPLPEGSKYLGFIFAREGSPERVEAALRKSYGMLGIGISDR